jgi:hypothetical protein
VTTIVDGPFYYVYDEILGRGAAIERNTTAIAEDATRGRPFGREREDLLASGGELVRDGESTEDQMSFDVYQLFFTPPQTINFQRLTYREYTQRAGHEAIGPAPVYYRDLLHGKKRFEE